MKKVIFLILFFIAFNSINSIAKYSNIVEYNFLTKEQFEKSLGDLTEKMGMRQH